MSLLLDILKKIGRNVEVQYLAEAMVKSVDKKRTQYTEVTFATNSNNTNGLMTGKGKTAVIVWVDKDEFNNAMIELNNSMGEI